MGMVDRGLGAHLCAKSPSPFAGKYGMVGVGEAMKIDTYSWRLQWHHPAYVFLWLAFWGWCVIGPLLFPWSAMGRYIWSVMLGFWVLGWLTWSKPGGVIFNKPPVEGIKR